MENEKIEEFLLKLWVEKSSALDKLLLTISAAAIGFLLNLVFNGTGKIANLSYLKLAIIFFTLVCSLSVIILYTEKNYIRFLMEEKDKWAIFFNSVLHSIDILSGLFFLAAVILTATVLYSNIGHA